MIKDSVMVKTNAFEQIFLPYGSKVVSAVCRHHEANGGMSRFEKMPIYLGWAGESVNAEKVHEFCECFALRVEQAVIDSPWVPGVREYLLANYMPQCFILVTATPQDEMLRILDALEIATCFLEVHGAPKSKVEAVRDVLVRLQCPPDQALMVGDSESDLMAAQANQVPFLLRRTPLNQPLQERCDSPIFDVF